MATDFTQESVLRFLLGRDGTVRNAELLAHFKGFLRDDDEERAQNRELFKRYVNSVATVRQEDGVSYVVLRKKYRHHLAGDVAAKNRNEKKQEAKAAGGKPAPSQSRIRSRSRSRDQSEVNNPKAQKGTHAPPAHDATHNNRTQHILPVAGIVNNNDLQTVNLEKLGKSSSLHKLGSTVPSGTQGGEKSDTVPEKLPPDSKRSSGSGQSFEQQRPQQQQQQHWDLDLKEPASSGLQHNGVYAAQLGLEQLREADGCCQQSFCPPQEGSPYREVSPSPTPRGVCLSENTAHTRELLDSHLPYEESFDWPFPILLGQSQNSASSPCLVDIPAAAESSANSWPATYSQGTLSRSSDSILSPGYGNQINFYLPESEDYVPTPVAPVSSVSQRRSLPSQTLHLPLAAAVSRSSSNSSLPIHLLAEPEWPRPLFRDEWGSDDTLNYRDAILGHDGNQIRASVCHSHEAELLSQLHHPERHILSTPWHHSTGHLLDEEPQSSLPASAPGDGASHGPVARRLSHRLRSRMCRSLGSDLDQAFREDGEAARIKRLHRITSFLHVNYPMSASSSRTHSTLDGLSPAGSVHSIGQDVVSNVQRHPQVPLDAREHEWFVKAAAGTWTDIYSLFREEPSLLFKRDFVSGYTVLHWIAKHGDHRVLNTLYYGINKAGVGMDINARSTCGYTPLHVAAIHGHKNLLRLLVHKYKADVSLRDNSGKKAWQYLEKNDQDLLETLGAPRRVIWGGVGLLGKFKEKPPVPPGVTSATTVKRQSSLAALFKHKSHLRVSANSETFL